MSVCVLALKDDSAEIIHQNAPAEGLVTSKYNTATTSRYNWTWLCDVPASPEADVHMASMGNVEMCTMTWMKIQRSMMMMSTYQDLVWFNFRETIDVREQSVKWKKHVHPGITAQSIFVPTNWFASGTAMIILYQLEQNMQQYNLIFVTTTIFVMFGGLNHFVTVVIENIKKDIAEIHCCICIRMIVLAVSLRWDSYWFDILAANKERISRAWNLE